MEKNILRIKLKSFDHRLLEKACRDLIVRLNNLGASISGPIPLPRAIERFTVNRSPHVNKKSREQFEIRTQKRLIVISNPKPNVMDELLKVALPAGVDADVKFHEEAIV